MDDPIDFPQVTAEQRARFKKEFEQYWDRLDHGPHGNTGNRTEQQRVWCLARAYSEMQIQNLLSPDVTLP